jgi:twitching motility two-component system response regulator PilH
VSLLDRLKQLFAEAKATPLAPEPVAQTADAPIQPEARQERRRKKRVNAVAGTRVLIVDDSPTIVALLSRMLRQNNYAVMEAGDGETALEIARRERPGLIFLDIVLPGMSGFTALRTLRHDPVTKDIPIVMISGNAQATEQFYVQRIGADNFMKKPFSRAEVFTYIERLLDEQFVPRRFNTYVHDTTLEMLPEPPEAPELVVEPERVPEPVGVQTTEPATQSEASEPAAQSAASEPVAQEAASEPVTQSAASEPVAQEAASEPVTDVQPTPVTRDDASAMIAAAIASLEADEPESETQAETAPIELPLAPAAEPEPEPPPASRDIFVDINAGWRRL